MYGWTERWKMDGKKPQWEDLFHACAEAGLDAVEIDADTEKLKLARSFGGRIGLLYRSPFTYTIQRSWSGANSVTIC